MRCVEALVDGHPVGWASRWRSCSQRVEPTRQARSTSRSRRCCDPKQMPGQSDATSSTGRTSRACAWTRRCTRSRSWPPASTARRCRTQNGAPLRLVVPWKYGFKGIKSIVKITLRREAAADHLERCGAERVRLLRQRQPAMSTTRAGARPPSGASASSAAARRCRSTATPTRSRASTRAWIWPSRVTGMARQTPPEARPRRPHLVRLRRRSRVARPSLRVGR